MTLKEDIPDGYEIVPVDWCRLCCDGRLTCVCGDPAFSWQKQILDDIKRNID